MALDISSPILFGGGYVKQLSGGLGFNNTPSTADVQIVVDTSGVAGDAQTFAESSLLPGNISGIVFDQFKFTGIVQSWQLNSGANGDTYNIKMSDPRLVFNDIIVSLDGRGPSLPTLENITAGSGLPNYINVYNYFGNDWSADYNENGMAWNRIKEALVASGIINIYGKQFLLDFEDDGFDAPEYFRINANSTSLDQVLQSAADKLAVDFFVYIDSDTYDPTNTYNSIKIKTVKRNDAATAGDSIDEYIANKRAEGRLVNYSRGKELRTGPTHSVLQGANYTYVYSTNKMYPAYGRGGNGAIVTAAGNSVQVGPDFQSLDNAERHLGYVSLDHIVTDSVNIQNRLPQVDSDGNERGFAGGTYPPTVFATTITTTKPGYRPTENVMRAALWSREAWEALLFNEQNVIAAQIGINALIIHDSEELTTWAADNKFNLLSDAQDVLERTEEDEALISAIYEATKESAEAYYGRSFVVELPIGTVFPASVGGSTINFRYPYRVLDAAWHENASLALKNTSNQNFRDDFGKIKSHLTLINIRDTVDPSVIITNPDGRQYGTTDIVKWDISKISKADFLEDGVNMHFSISAEQDPSNLARAIITLSNPLPFKNFIQDDLPASYVEFWRAMGLEDEDIVPLLKFYEYNKELGLAPQRATNFDLVQIPLQNTYSRYGPFLATTSRPGGVTLNQDDSIAPWTYGGTGEMNIAGQALCNMALQSRTVIDSAQLSIAGTPEKNLGDVMGENANITSINLDFSSAGLVTNYSLQTFTYPLTRMAKILYKKTLDNSIKSNKLDKDILRLDDEIKRLRKEYTPTIDENGLEQRKRSGYYNIGKYNQSGSVEEVRPPTKHELMLGDFGPTRNA